MKDEQKKEEEKKEERKKKKRPILLILALIWVIAWLWSWVPVTEHIMLDLLPSEDKNIRIVLITDLHSCWYGSGQKDLLQRIDREYPDLIMLAGDFFDDVVKDKNAKITAEYLAKKYPCYYVTGNHEFWSGRADEMKEYMENIGIHVLAGGCETVTIHGCDIDVCGVDDPTDIGISSWREQLEYAYTQSDPAHLRLLLTHRPEMVKEYERYDFDLIMAGHAHGGQFLIPFINKGLYAPDQGLLAEYVNGIYELPNGSIMEVSRGLGRESTPAPRFFDHPEVVVLDIN
ncbi:MAG: metallophosphoesterase [Lachnospiraceae bacterium]|nr:metallophosphoesterase [Lachnospiraceae bacterium]MBR6850040.1 metallophosphoesterase [Lachnospiraceae bacterium]MBR7075450.1 metallophosphoesterase [Lachnospiraceae bacterium]